MQIKVGVSNKHVHLTEEVYKILFKDRPLEKVRDLDQPGQFASNAFVDIMVHGVPLTHLRVVGPLRTYNQVEVSRTDAYKLKVNPPIRQSGDLEDSLPVTIIGPEGKVELSKGLIVPNRHIHISPEEYREKGFKGDKCWVKIEGQKPGYIQVNFKVLRNSNFVLHLDTDDGNGFGLKTGDIVEILEDNNITLK